MSTEEKVVAAAASGVSVCVIDHDLQLLHALGSAIAAQPDFGEPLLLDHGKNVFPRMRRFAPKVVLVAVEIASDSGFRFLRAVRQKLPAVRLIVMAGSESGETVSASISAGADGCILKPIDLEQVVGEIRSAAIGHPVLPDEVVRQILQQYLLKIRQPEHAGPPTDSELRVLQLTTEGRSCREIASKLGISTATVYALNKSLYSRLNINSRVAAIAWYRNQGGRLPHEAACDAGKF